MSRSPSLSPDTIRAQAAAWLVRLTADGESDTARLRQEYETWKQADPRHAETAASMETFIDQIHAVHLDNNSRPARAALNAAFTKPSCNQRCKNLGTPLALLLVAGVSGWLALQAYPLAHLTADIHTRNGQWQMHTLEDGSTVTLNGKTAVNVKFDAAQRTLELVEGEILVNVARDAARPFVVITSEGNIRALGTRFVVSHGDGLTNLSILESQVLVHLQRPEHSSGEVISAGQRIHMAGSTISTPELIDTTSLDIAWTKHHLVVQDDSLPDVLDQLNRHHPGYIRYNRTQLEHIRVSAILPLDDTNRALQLLGASFTELNIRRFTPYLVIIDLAASQPLSASTGK